jgi:hypothetical protein
MTRQTIPQSVKDAIRNPHAFPGGYPKYIVCNDGSCLCPKCAKDNYRAIAHDTVKQWRTGWDVAAVDINWEDDSLYCDNCNNTIPSAYGEES